MFIGWALMTLTVVTVLSVLCGLDIDYEGWTELMAPALPASIGALFYAKKIGWQRIADAAECLIASLAITPAIVFSTFVAVGLNMPLADGFLSYTDRILGFDWLGLVHLLDQNRLLVLALGVAYVSFSPATSPCFAPFLNRRYVWIDMAGMTPRRHPRAPAELSPGNRDFRGWFPERHSL